MHSFKSFKLFCEDDEPVHPEEGHDLPKLKWNKDPKIGWWKDGGDHHVMYHGTHERNLHHIAKHGINAPSEGPTKGNVSMTHDPHTAHAYASMSGGESSFRKAGGKAEHTPHNKRAVLVAHIPKDWAEKHMNQHLRGNMPETKNRLLDKNEYEKHKASGKPDHQYYQTTELRFKDHIPREFIKGYMKKEDG